MSDPIRAAMSTQIKAGLVEYRRQWKAWRDACDAEAYDKGFTGGRAR